MTSFDGRVALITGASSGIGEATARTLCAEGVAVAGAARRTAQLGSLVEDLTRCGGSAIAVRLDVADPASCQDAVDTTIRAFGHLDIVVNAAGVMLLGPVALADILDWRRTIDTNLFGLMHMTHAALPHLLPGEDRRQSGDDTQPVKDIVNISSVAGRVATAGAAAYSASKTAVNAFSESLRQEVTRQGVRVSVIGPGAVDTELTEHITDRAAKDATERFYAQMRNLQPDDVARAVSYIVNQPAHVAVSELLLRPTDQM